MNIAFAIGAIIGVIGAGHAMVRMFRLVSRRLPSRVMQPRMTALSKSIRARARRAMLLHQNARHEVHATEITGLRVAEEQEQVGRLERTQSHLYVLDDHRQPDDGAYVVKVRHPDFTQVAPGAPPELVGSWSQGRRFVLWAADPARALRRAATRCPASKGYVLNPTLDPL